MDSLIASIIAARAGADASAIAYKAATLGGVWLSEAPQDAIGTYVVITVIGALIENTIMSDAFTIEAQIQFMVCSPNNATEAVTAKNALVALYKDNMLSDVIYARPLDAGILMRDPDSKGYLNTVVFKFIMKG